MSWATAGDNRLRANARTSSSVVPGTSPCTPANVTIQRSPSTGSTAAPRNDLGGEVPQNRKLPSKSSAERGRKPLVYAQSMFTRLTGGARIAEDVELVRDA